MNYYLLDHPNPNGDHFVRTSVRQVRGIVIHTAENVADTVGPDGGAEAVANYGATAARSVSWHATVDKDSIIYMLPDEYTAYHVIGYNNSTLGIEQACQSAKWNTYPPEWVDGTIANTAKVVGDWCEKYRIPKKRITKAEFDSGAKGIMAHADLDPLRRSDPGADYPWDLLFEKMEDDMALSDEDIQKIAEKVWQARLGPSVGNITLATAIGRTYGLSLKIDTLPEEVADLLAARLTDTD